MTTMSGSWANGLRHEQLMTSIPFPDFVVTVGLETSPRRSGLR